MGAPRLLLITDPDARRGIVAPIEEALTQRGGHAVTVQLRAKSASARSLYEAALALRQLTRAVGARLVVNTRADIARAVGADGVHLPEGGLPVAATRSILPGALVGVSCHDAAGLERAAEEGADYAVLGPIAAVPGKNPPLGLAGFERLVASARLPVLALGGVRVEDVSALCRAGAHGVAVIRAVTHASDPAAATDAFIRALDRSAGDAR
ncbi:MAG: thiamine phosphate synthase [Polyangiaceae bacterium]|nr:thiamine phosphate synthase [Polyangiaceae bacterium]